MSMEKIFCILLKFTKQNFVTGIAYSNRKSNYQQWYHTRIIGCGNCWNRNYSKMLNMLSFECLVVTKRSHILKQIWSFQLCMTFLLQPDIKGIKITVVIFFDLECIFWFLKIFDYCLWQSIFINRTQLILADCKFQAQENQRCIQNQVEDLGRPCEKYRNFTWFPDVEILRKGTVSV